MGGDYARLGGRVNRGVWPSGARALLLTLGALLALPAAGCVAPAPAPPVGYFVAMRHDAEPWFADRGRAEALAGIREDLYETAQLGFTTAALARVDDEDRDELLKLVAAAGLDAVVGGRELQRRVVAEDALSRQGGGTGARLKTPARWKAAHHPAWRAILLEADATPELTAQWLAIAARLAREGVRVVCVVPAEAPAFGGMLTIPAHVPAQEEGASATEHFLACFHAGLGAGQTGGLLVDRYRAWGSSETGLKAGGEAFPPALATALQTLTQRARRWGPLLHEATARRIALGPSGVTGREPTDAARPEREGAGAAMTTPSEVEDDRDAAPVAAPENAVVATEFARGRRHYLMVFNSSPREYAREVVTVPVGRLSGAARRAVEVPASPAQVAGRVVEARGGRLVVKVDLRPGEALLFELF
ncbi:MAG TPA: hypothetical protein PKK06_18035 [Phycisphaerae bacterium]|nr:hypothetical protein [Phycisphaerae bacterium]HNU47117.1 hypothetical protein [Phycisphaerae bacterium]